MTEKGEYKRRDTWRIGRIDELSLRKDDVIRVVRIKTAKCF